MLQKRFKEKYNTEIIQYLQGKYNYNNVHEVPQVTKIVINMGVGEVVASSKVIDSAIADLTLISGQKPLITKAKKSIAGFKLREGMKVGCKVTLRKEKMYDFLERLVIVALPRIKQFRGMSSKNFDKNGNLNFGIKEQIIFPEIKFDQIDVIRGMNITIVTSAKTDAESKDLLAQFEIPFYN